MRLRTDFLALCSFTLKFWTIFITTFTELNRLPSLIEKNRNSYRNNSLLAKANTQNPMNSLENILVRTCSPPAVI